MDAVGEICDRHELGMIGFCAGGILLSGVLNHLAAQGDERVKAASFAVTLLDFDSRAAIGAFSAPRLLELAQKQSRRKGVITGRTLGNVFTWMRPDDLVFNYWVNNYLMGENPPVFDILAWNADSTNLPARLHAEFLDIFKNNTLCQPGGTEILGTPVDLSRITVPTFVTGAITDHLTPWKGCYRTTELVGGQSTFILSNAGHIAALVNPPGNPKASLLRRRRSRHGPGHLAQVGHQARRYVVGGMGRLGDRTRRRVRAGPVVTGQRHASTAGACAGRLRPGQDAGLAAMSRIVQMTSRLAVVSGAGSGIGAACAERLAAAGFAVILVGRRSQALEATAAAIREATASARVICLPADVSEPDDVRALAERIGADFEFVDVIVNNAGAPAVSHSDDLADLAAAWLQTYRANTLTAVLLTTALEPLLRSPGGRVILIGSKSARAGNASPAYGTAKAALDRISGGGRRPAGPAGHHGQSRFPGLYREHRAHAGAYAAGPPGAHHLQGHARPAWAAGGDRCCGGIPCPPRCRIHHRSGADRGRRGCTLMVGAGLDDVRAPCLRCRRGPRP